MTMIGVSVEEERTFSGMNFLKSKLRNRLDGHLDMCMRFFCQDFYTMQSFPYDRAYKAWGNAKNRGMDG